MTGRLTAIRPGQPWFDTAIADDVWLPIRFDGRHPVIDWRDEWSPDDYPDIEETS